jgi:hypothetical protein
MLSHAPSSLQCSYLLELAISGAHTDLPSVINPLIDAGSPGVLGSQVEVHIVLKGLDGQLGTVEIHLRGSGQEAWEACQTHKVVMRFHTAIA